ncbi:MAG: hypothetical protein ACFFAY_13125 [Promethearchaeota archaeon]
MNGLIQKRRLLRSRIRENTALDERLHWFASSMLVVNMALILYAVLSITIRMSLSGLALLDSLPIGLYILPLMVIFPLFAKAYFEDRFAPFNFIVLILSSAIFAILSVLVRGFVIFTILNIFAIIIIFIMGRFRPNTSLRKVGPRGVAIFLFFNILGLMFPITTVVMGANPIAQNPGIPPEDIAVSIPLADFEFPYVPIEPSPSLLSLIESQGMSVDLRVLENDTDSLNRLWAWLHLINDSSVEYTLTLTSPRGSFLVDNSTLGTTQVLGRVASSHIIALTSIFTEFVSMSITSLPSRVLYDMTLSTIEWKNLMAAARSINLVGFGDLIRNSVDFIDIATLDSLAGQLMVTAHGRGMEAGVLVDSFVLDDLQDGDTIAMRVCGLTMNNLGSWDAIEVLCSRSSFSYEMNGDVGEYLVHSYSRSLVPGGVARGIDTDWSIRIGTVGNGTNIEGNVNTIYNTLASVADDIVTVGSAVSTVTVDSLPALLGTFGNNALSDLTDIISTITEVSITYTFRVYAFRAVFIAIDSFDPIMF